MMKITTWGTRGSLPTAGTRYVRHGGATTCIEVVLEGASPETPTRIIIDCGSGLADLGRRHFAEIKDALFLQTHLHWDHIQGFPFFGPFFKPGARFQFMAAPRDGASLEHSLRSQMKAPNFPVGIDLMPSDLRFEDIERKGELQLGELRLSWAEMCHPSDGSTAWRLDYRGASFVFTGDCEVELGGRKELIDLAQGVDLLVMDAQYFEDEYAQKTGWGHSTPGHALSVAREAGVKRLLLTHHDPSHDDERLDQKAEWARRRAGSVLVGNAHDSMVVELHADQLALAS